MRQLGLVVAIVLSVVAGTAAAQPMQLTSNQMDKVVAGHFEMDVSNTSVTMLDIWFTPYLLTPTPNTIACPNCYLRIISPRFSIVSQFGP